MANILNPFYNAPATVPQPSPDGADSDATVEKLNGPSDLAPAHGVKSAVVNSAPDAYGVVPEGPRGNVLSTMPPVPGDAIAGDRKYLPSAESKVTFLNLNHTTVGGQALALGAEDPMTQDAQPNSVLHQASKAGASDPAANPDGQYIGNDPSSSSSLDTEEAQKAEDMSKTWIDHVGKHCSNAGGEMSHATGLGIKESSQAYELMKFDTSDVLAKQIGTAMAVLAQEKQEGSPSYAADKAKVAAALQTLTDNYRPQSPDGQDDTAANNKCFGALTQLSEVVTGHLGGDPNGVPQNNETFDPSSARVINPWA